LTYKNRSLRRLEAFFL